MADKRYVGKGWEHTFPDGGSVVNLSLNIEDLGRLPVDQYGCVKVTVSRMKSQDTKSKATHTVYENTFTRNNRNEERRETEFQPTDDFPF